MKIAEEYNYFNDSVWGIFRPDENREDTLLLIKTVSSYKIQEINEQTNRLLRIGYKITSPLIRRFFKYKIQFGRIIPLYQRLIAHDAIKFIKDEKGAECRIPTKVFVDKLLYTDEDLELIKQHHEPYKGPYIDLDKMIENKKNILNEESDK